MVFITASKIEINFIPSVIATHYYIFKHIQLLLRDFFLLCKHKN